MANEQPGAFDFDRERGIFTPRDRRFLAGELDDDLSDDAKRQKRYRLRKRTLHALQDLHYLGAMSKDDTHAIGTSIYEDEDAERRFTSGVREFLNYLYDLYGRGGFIDLFEFALEWQGMQNYYRETGNYAEFTADVEVTRSDPITLEELAAESAERQLTPLEKIILGESVEAYSAYEPRHPELIAPVLDVAADLDNGLGADWGEVCERVMERTDADRGDVMEAMEDAVLTGQAEAPAVQRVFRVRESAEK
jgi:hypothetical protein